MSSERQYDTSPLMPTEIERRHVEGSISRDNLGDRFSLTGEIEDPEEAIRTARQDITVVPQHIKKIDNLEEAIQIAHQAVAATHSDHPRIAGWLSNLGNALKGQYEQTGQMD